VQDPLWKHQAGPNDKTTDPTFDRPAWRDKHFTFAKETSSKWTREIAARFGDDDTRYAAVGYCFGAPFVLEAISEGGIASVAAFAHPTNLTEEQFRAIKKPLFLSCAEHDAMFPADKRHLAENVLSAAGKKFHIQLFQGVSHGFAVRCDLENPYERFVKEQSYKGIVEWFNFWLAQES
jgi:dienelactone hydrolase